MSETEFFVPAQLVGYLALVTYISAYLVRSDNKLKLIFSGSNILWIVHYFWIGARTAALTTAIVTVRNLLSLNSKDFTSRKKIVVACVFSFLLVIAGIVTWAGYVSVIPVTGCILVSFGMIYLHGINLRFLLMFLDTGWILHGWLVGSISGMIYGVSAVIVNCLGILRLYRMPSPVT